MKCQRRFVHEGNQRKYFQTSGTQRRLYEKYNKVPPIVTAKLTKEIPIQQSKQLEFNLMSIGNFLLLSSTVDANWHGLAGGTIGREYM